MVSAGVSAGVSVVSASAAGVSVAGARLRGRGLGRRRRLFCGPLLLQCGREPGDLRRRSVEQAGRLGEVALHRAGQLGQQHLAGLQVCDALDFGDGQRATVHVAALDDQRLVLLGEGLERLRDVNGLAADKGDRGRPDEQLVETLDPRLRRRPLDQCVLGNRVGRRTSQRPAQLGQVCYGQAAIIGDHGGSGIPELLGNVCNGGGLVSPGHATSLRVLKGLARK